MRYKQIGRRPQFFDVSKPMILDEFALQIWSGFKASAFNSESGITLAIDNIFKFMSTTSCLVKINELKRKAAGDKSSFEKAVRAEFQRKSVIANWGSKRTYVVTDVEFDKNPST